VAHPPAEASSPTSFSASSLQRAGTVLECDSTIIATTGDGVLHLEEIQPAGKRAMAAEDFLRGVAMRVGDRLG